MTAENVGLGGHEHLVASRSLKECSLESALEKRIRLERLRGDSFEAPALRPQPALPRMRGRVICSKRGWRGRGPWWQDRPAIRAGQVSYGDLVFRGTVARQARAAGGEHPARIAMTGDRRANAVEVQARYLPSRIGRSARGQIEIDKREVQIGPRMEGGRVEGEMDLVARAQAGRALDLVQPEVVTADRCAGAIVAAGVVDRHPRLELPGP